VTLEFGEVVVQLVETRIHHHLVFGGPLLQWSQARGIEAIEAVSTDRTAPDQSHLAKHPKVLGHLGLRDGELVDDRPYGHLTADQRVKDLATM
jgi:hypothetical protein